MTVNQLVETMDDEVVINGCSYVSDDMFKLVCHTMVADFRKLRDGSLKWFAYATVVDESLGIVEGEIYFDIEGVWTEEDRK